MLMLKGEIWLMLKGEIRLVWIRDRLIHHLMER